MSTGNSKPDVLQGTLDLMVLRTLESMGPQHGFGLARRINRSLIERDYQIQRVVAEYASIGVCLIRILICSHIYLRKALSQRNRLISSTTANFFRR